MRGSDLTTTPIDLDGAAAVVETAPALPGSRRLVRLPVVGAALAAAVAAVAAISVVAGTVLLTIRYHDPLPWFDEWATIDLLRAWRHGETWLIAALVSRHNEHRILFPRLVFFADDLWFGGRGWLSLAAIDMVQAVHAALFAGLVARARPMNWGSLIVFATVLALMFGLGQVENFASGFQLQFFGVFAAATASFVLFGTVIARSRQGRPSGIPLGGSLAMAAVATFTMANGILAAALLPVLAVVARLRREVVALTAAWAVLLAAVSLQGQPITGQGSLLAHLWPPGLLVAYETTYLGNVLQFDRIASPATLGTLALAIAAVAAARLLREPGKPASVALFGAMLFVILSGIVTASGRMEYGVQQALSSRYVTGAVMFWAAALCYGWIDPPRGRGRRAVEAGVLLGAAVLLFGTCRTEKTGKYWLRVQHESQARAIAALLDGRDDPAAIAAGAGPVDRVTRLAPVLRELGISIFAGRGTEHPGASAASSP